MRSLSLASKTASKHLYNSRRWSRTAFVQKRRQNQQKLPRCHFKYNFVVLVLYLNIFCYFNFQSASFRGKYCTFYTTTFVITVVTSSFADCCCMTAKLVCFNQLTNLIRNMISIFVYVARISVSQRCLIINLIIPGLLSK